MINLQQTEAKLANYGYKGKPKPFSTGLITTDQPYSYQLDGVSWWVCRVVFVIFEHITNWGPRPDKIQIN